MKLNERQKQIVELVNQKQRVSVKALAEALYFTEMTIRRDLVKLENEGYLHRYRGGAIAMCCTEQYPIDQRMYMNEQEKRELARRAAAYLHDDQTILLCGNSSCAYLLPFLKEHKNLHILTDSLQFLTTLSDMQIRCTICGGECFAADKILIGHASENFFRQFNYDIAFIGCDGIDDDGTISVLREHSAQLCKIALANAEKCIILADHSKLHTRSRFNICNVTEDENVILFLKSDI